VEDVVTGAGPRGDGEQPPGGRPPSAAGEALLPGGLELPFAEVEGTLARLAAEERARRPAPVALTATIVVIGERERLVEAADALKVIGERGGVRGILISVGDDPAPRARVAPYAIALEHLRLDFVNNAVAAFRLSSLPTLVWWRGGSLDALDGIAQLAERLVLDTDPPEPVWTRVPSLFERTAVTDLRWTRLTRWRALMANFFDMPEIRDAASEFTTLRVVGSDRGSSSLFAGWLESALEWNGRVASRIEVRPEAAPLESVELGGPGRVLRLAVVSRRTCVEACLQEDHQMSVSRVVPLADERLPALLLEELRVRSRDVAFERALRAGAAR
jgi:hypothetical protein